MIQGSSELREVAKEFGLEASKKLEELARDIKNGKVQLDPDFEGRDEKKKQAYSLIEGLLKDLYST